MWIVLFIIMLPFSFLAQGLIKGHIQDEKSGLPIPYVSIGVVGKSIGTVSDENGDFELNLSTIQGFDSLKMMAIGYESLSITVAKYLKYKPLQFNLNPRPILLQEVLVKANKGKPKRLGYSNYSKNNCTGFADVSQNWKGSEAAVLIKNDKKVQLEAFRFFIIQNKYQDSLIFRLMLYSKIKNDWVGPCLLKTPIVFKVGLKHGEFTLALREYNLILENDFFLSLECLMDEMEITKFCYSGSLNIPSYYKVKAFAKWHSTKGTGSGGGGADFNVLVSVIK